MNLRAQYKDALKHSTIRKKMAAARFTTGSRSYTNSITLVDFEWLAIFLCVFIRSFRVFVRKAL